MMNAEAAVSFAVGEKFYSFEDLEDKICRLKEATGVELWRSDAAAVESAPKHLVKSLSEALKYYKVRYSCSHSSRKLIMSAADYHRKSVYVVCTVVFKLIYA